MLLSYILYSLLLIMMLYFSFMRNKRNLTLCHNQVNYLYDVVPIFLLTLILGNRYDVGLDFHSYKYAFEHNDNKQFEFLYRTISEFLWNNGFSFYTLLSLTVLVYFIFFYLSFKEYKYLLPYCILFFMSFGPFTFLLNGIRQAITFSIFIYSIKYIHQKSFCRFLILILIATGIHSFSLILLPLYVLIYLDFNKIKVPFLISTYILTFLVGDIVFGIVIEILLGELKTIGYGAYIENFGEEKMTYGTGLGILLMKSIDIILILYFDKLKDYFKNTSYSIIFFIYFLGLLLYNIVGLDLLGNRAIYCLISMRFIVAGYLLYYLTRKKYYHCSINRYVTTYLVVSSLMLFIANIRGGANGCSPFQFNF